jgi:hypothetical protein
MKLLWLVVVATLGCSAKKAKEAPPAPVAVADAADLACTEKVAMLADWMRRLVGEGHLMDSSNVNLVRLAEPPSPIPNNMAVVVKPDQISVDGKLVASPSTTKGIDLAKSYMEAIATVRDATGVVVLVEGTTPWSSVVAIANAVPKTTRAQVSFVFESSAPSAVETPPVSSIDADLAEIRRRVRSDNPDGTTAMPLDPSARVFKDCPGGLEILPKVADVSPIERDATLVDLLLAALAACDCRVEMPAVQRLMWAWWGRENGAQLVGVTIAMASTAKDGTVVKAAPTTPWSEAHKAVVDAAKAAKPLVFE